MNTRSQVKITHLALLALLSCAQPKSQSTLKIVSGSLVEPTSPAYAATVSLDANGIPFCSGVLLDNRTILTAAHCIVGSPSDAEISIGFGSARTGNKVNIPVNRHSQMVAHSGWDKSELYSANINPLPQTPKNDIGLVVLDTDAPTWAKSVPLKMIGPVNVGSTVMLAGFGQTRNIDQSGRNTQIEFGGELRSVLVELETINEAGNELVYKPSAANLLASSCHGDSGGPMYFLEEDHSITLIGITSRAYSAAEDCEGRGIYTDARKFQSWIYEQRATIMKNLGPSNEEWFHKHIQAEGGTHIVIDYQLSRKGLERTAKNLWVNVTNPGWNENEKVVIEINSYITTYISVKGEAKFEDTGRYTLRLTELEGKVVCSPYSRWGVQQAISVEVNGRKILSGQENPMEFSFRFCE